MTRPNDSRNSLTPVASLTSQPSLFFRPAFSLFRDETLLLPSNPAHRPVFSSLPATDSFLPSFSRSYDFLRGCLRNFHILCKHHVSPATNLFFPRFYLTRHLLLLLFLPSRRVRYSLSILFTKRQHVFLTLFRANRSYFTANEFLAVWPLDRTNFDCWLGSNFIRLRIRFSRCMCVNFTLIN